LMAQKRPFAIGVVGNYENFNYIREAPFMGQLFGVAGIKYIAYPYPDDRKVELKEDNISYYHNFAQQIDNLDWTADKVSSYPINIWKTNQAEDHFFITNNTYYILGSDRIYTELVNLPGFKLSNNALVFLEEGNEVNKLPSNKIILFDKKAVDLSAAVLPREKYISLAEGLPSSPDSSGWWKREAGDLIWWRDFLQQKYGIDNLDFDYGKGWGVAEGEKQLTVSNSQFSDGKLLLVRAMKSSKGGMIVFSQGGMEVGRVNTFDEKPQVVTQKLAGYGQIPEQMFEYDEADFSWYEVGRLVSGEPLVIATSGEINVVNTLVSVEKTEWSMAKEEANKLDIIYWQNITNEEKIALFAQAEDKPEIKYERLSPTNYKISVSGLTKPVTIVFSESFDSLWELNGGGAYPVYSFLNGFAVQEDGDYEVIFSAQKYANFGFVLSLASALVFLVAMLYLRIKYTKAKHV